MLWRLIFMVGFGFIIKDIDIMVNNVTLLCISQNDTNHMQIASNLDHFDNNENIFDLIHDHISCNLFLFF